MPSKLFVGNLPENVDSHKLKQIFQPFCKVTECDIVKNYAFVHIEEDDVDPIIQRLTGYSIEGKIVNIKKSISKLRPTPGMPNRCYRCQSDEHRTPQCPQDPNNMNKDVQTIKINLTGTATKRPAEPIIVESAKRSAYQGGSSVEAEIPQPLDPDLQQLYQEYQLSRQRYLYYRDRLLKEMEAKNHGSTAGYVLSSSVQIPSQTISTASQLSAAPVTYQPSPQNVPPAVPQNAPYMVNNSLRAPYATQSAPYVLNQSGSSTSQIAPYATQQTNNGVMTTQQYLQQVQTTHQQVGSVTGSSPLSVPQSVSNSATPQIPIKWA